MLNIDIFLGTVHFKVYSDLCKLSISEHTQHFTICPFRTIPSTLQTVHFRTNCPFQNITSSLQAIDYTTCLAVCKLSISDHTQHFTNFPFPRKPSCLRIVHSRTSLALYSLSISYPADWQLLFQNTPPLEELPILEPHPTLPLLHPLATHRLPPLLCPHPPISEASFFGPR